MCPAAGRIVFLNEGASTSGDIVIDRIQADDDSWFSVRSSASGDKQAYHAIDVPAGHYRVSSTVAGSRRVATCDVLAGQDTVVQWEEHPGEVAIDLVGSSWVSAQFSIECVEGLLRGGVRHIDWREPDRPMRTGQFVCHRIRRQVPRSWPDCSPSRPAKPRSL